MSNGTNTVSESLPNESPMASCQSLPSSAMSEHSSMKGTPEHIREWLMSCQGASHANHSVKLANVLEPMIHAICGLLPLNVYASFDPASASLRTFQAYLIPGISEPSSLTWPRAGMVSDGVCYRLAPLVRHTHGKDCSYWPTPTRNDARGGASAKVALQALNGELRKSGFKIQLRADDLFALRYGIQPKPIFWEWLMGWVPKWSASEPLEMDKFQRWLEQHGIFSRKG